MKGLMLSMVIMLTGYCLNAQDGNITKVNGVELYYETYGEGPTMVLLHHFCASHEIWNQWIEQLSKDYYLVVPDLRGHGKSSNPTQTYEHQESARDIYRLLEHLEVDEFKAIGAGAGSMALLEMARMEPQRISSMVILSPGICHPPEEKAITSFNSAPEDWLSHMKKIHAGGESQIRMLISQYKQLATQYERIYPDVSQYDHIDCPVLIIHDESKQVISGGIPISPASSDEKTCRKIAPHISHTSIDNQRLPEKLVELTRSFIKE